MQKRRRSPGEVDVMPFLGRTSEGGPFNAYYEALSTLGAEYVRLSPWLPNPRVPCRRAECAVLVYA